MQFGQRHTDAFADVFAGRQKTFKSPFPDSGIPDTRFGCGNIYYFEVRINIRVACFLRIESASCSIRFFSAANILRLDKLFP